MSDRLAKQSKSVLGKLPEFFKQLVGREIAPKTRPPKIGIALSSGGAKGLCHIGVLEVLEENNIPIHAISGSSMGAYIAALYADGVSIPRMQELAEEIGTGSTLNKLTDLAFPMVGFIHGRKAQAHLEKTIAKQTFENLQRELLVIATDLDTFERVVFRKGLVSEAVHASCAIPGVVVPPTLQGRRLTDGGVIDPVPVSSLIKFCECDHIIAVSTVRKLDDIDNRLEANQLALKEAKLSKKKNNLFSTAISKMNKHLNPTASGNILDTLRRSIRAAQIRLAHESTKRATVALHPAARFPCQWHDYHLYEQFIEYGREAAINALPELKKLTEPIPYDHSPKASVVGNRVA